MIGVIVFLILVTVNFLVITKGATRIAEVGARFSLDAMPGKQMAIDADLSAGLVTEEEARRRRREVEDESAFYGSMDGASKFVRGDAIAGLIITAINVVGGVFIGMLRHDLTLREIARHLYAFVDRRWARHADSCSGYLTGGRTHRLKGGHERNGGEGGIWPDRGSAEGDADRRRRRRGSCARTWFAHGAVFGAQLCLGHIRPGYSGETVSCSEAGRQAGSAKSGRGCHGGLVTRNC